LIMIGVSGESSEALSPKFIKQGANDFLRKPFHPEEFYCRIIHNIESLELIETITFNAQRDHLTGLFHRSHFFNLAREHYNYACQHDTPLAMAVINIDDFSRVNHIHGNAWGDEALKQIAKKLQQMLGRFVLARADSDDFYVLVPGVENDKAVGLINKVKQLLAAEVLIINSEPMHFSFSAGVTNGLLESFDAQVSRAKVLLRRAKEAGGQMIVDDEDEDAR
jgi:diguanylate cyclase (GGDEF)-like protein